MAIQLHSNFANGVEQGELPLTRPPAQDEIPLAVIMQRKDLLGAINLCIDVCGLDDKELYVSLGIDAGHWSNIRKGKGSAHFPTNKLCQLMVMCGNRIPLIWLAHANGYGLHMLETEAERQLRQATDELAREREKTSLLLEALKGGR